MSQDLRVKRKAPFKMTQNDFTATQSLSYAVVEHTKAVVVAGTSASTVAVNFTTGPTPPIALTLKAPQPAQSTLLVAVTVDGKIVLVGP